MLEISMLDKLKAVFNMTTSSILFPITILFLIFVSFMFVTTNKNNSEKSIRTYISIYLLLFLLIIVRYWDGLSTMFDYMMDNVFIALYFPNIAVYLIAIIITNIIMWISMFSTKTKKIIKIVNSVAFSILHYLLILVLSIINTNKLNVFDQAALYNNINVHSLIELSSNIFVLWISFLIVYRLVMKYINARTMKKIEDLSVERIGERYNEITSVRDFIKEVDAPIIVKREPTHEKVKVVYELPKTTYTDVKIVEEDNKEEVKIIEEETENKLSDLLSLYESIN